MTRERLYIYDTTLRDGQQTQGVQFSTPEKIQIAEMLDTLGVDYVEGGWPGANPTDSAFFEAGRENQGHNRGFWHDQTLWPLGRKRRCVGRGDERWHQCCLLGRQGP